MLTILERVEDTENYAEKLVQTTRSQHAPWKDRAQQEGRVPKHWIRAILTSRDVLPFAVGTPGRCIVPAGKNGALLERPEHECEFWKVLEDVYQNYRGKGRNTPRTLVEQIDFNEKLSVQMGRGSVNENTVLYPVSADIMRATFTGAEGVIDSSLYYWQAPSKEEALYLVTVLNAECLREAFLQCRESGRHFHQHPWRKVPIPRFNDGNRKHRELAELGTQAITAVGTCMATTPQHLGQVGISKRIRSCLHETGLAGGIDDAVRKIMPAGVAQPKKTTTKPSADENRPG